MRTSATSTFRTMAATFLALTLLVSAAVSTTAQDEFSAVGSGGLVEVPEAGFALTLPLDWTYVRPQVSDLDDIIFALGDVEPEVATMVQSAMATTDFSLALMAFAPYQPVRFAENLNIISLPTDGMSLELISGANMAQMEGMGWSPELTTHELPVGEAARIDYAANLGGRDLEFSTWVYVDGETQHNLTFTSSERPDDGWLSIASTFEFLSGQ